MEWLPLPRTKKASCLMRHMTCTKKNTTGSIDKQQLQSQKAAPSSTTCRNGEESADTRPGGN